MPIRTKTIIHPNAIPFYSNMNASSSYATLTSISTQHLDGWGHIVRMYLIYDKLPVLNTHIVCSLIYPACNAIGRIPAQYIGYSHEQEHIDMVVAMQEVASYRRAKIARLKEYVFNTAFYDAENNTIIDKEKIFIASISD